MTNRAESPQDCQHDRSELSLSNSDFLRSISIFFLLIFLIVSIPSFAADEPDDSEGVPNEMMSLRDPFKKPALMVEKQVPRSPLERFATEQFKMSGAITGLDRLKAILVDPEGKTHFVTEGMKIGQRKGVIIQITADKVRIREKIMNVLNREEDQYMEVPLRSENEMKLGGAGK